MLEIPTLDELYEIRRRLSEECGGDLNRYAEMLQQVSRSFPGRYITQPFPEPAPPEAGIPGVECRSDRPECVQEAH